MFRDLALLRYERKLTQRELADLAGISKTAVTKIENGDAKPKVDTLVRLSRALDIPPDKLLLYLIDGEDI